MKQKSLLQVYPSTPHTLAALPPDAAGVPGTSARRLFFPFPSRSRAGLCSSVVGGLGFRVLRELSRAILLDINGRGGLDEDAFFGLARFPSSSPWSCSALLLLSTEARGGSGCRGADRLTTSGGWCRGGDVVGDIDLVEALGSEPFVLEASLGSEEAARESVFLGSGVCFVDAAFQACELSAFFGSAGNPGMSRTGFSPGLVGGPLDAGGFGSTALSRGAITACFSCFMVRRFSSIGSLRGAAVDSTNTGVHRSVDLGTMADRRAAGFSGVTAVALVSSRVRFGETRTARGLLRGVASASVEKSVIFDWPGPRRVRLVGGAFGETSVTGFVGVATTLPVDAAALAARLGDPLFRAWETGDAAASDDSRCLPASAEDPLCNPADMSSVREASSIQHGFASSATCDSTSTTSWKLPRNFCESSCGASGSAPSF